MLASQMHSFHPYSQPNCPQSEELWYKDFVYGDKVPQSKEWWQEVYLLTSESLGLPRGKHSC